MKRLPFVLVYSRLVLAMFIGFLAFMNWKHTPVWMVSLMSIGLLTDILDGIIARRLGVANEKLRVWDSTVDLFFWLVVIFSVFYLHHRFIQQNYLPVLVIVVLEAAAYMLSFLKFNKPIATHSYLAKFWTLTLFAFLADLTLHSESKWLFNFCAFIGIVSRLEIILIIFSLKGWTTDVASILSVGRTNRERK